MKKVLIITYYWPPAGGAGVQRVLKFAKYLPQFGWQPIILTIKNPEAPVVDESLIADIPEKCKVYYSKIWEPFNIYKKVTGKKKDEKIPSDVMLKQNKSLKHKFAHWVRVNLFIPDAKIGWIPYAVKKGIEVIEKENIDIIFSTSPPHTIGLIAKKIAKKTGLKWFADFRDPWLEILHNQNVKRSWLTKKIDASFEKGVLQNADALISVSPDIIDLFKKKIGNSNYKVLANGYDESDFSEQGCASEDIFTISYTGVLSLNRIPYPLLNAMERLKNENTSNFQLVLAGTNCAEFDSAVEEKGLTDFVVKRGYLSHKNSTQLLQSSDTLLLVIDDVPDNKGFLTGKIFEYFGCRKPIYAIGPVSGNANDLMKETNSGEMVGYKDDEGAYQLLKKMIKNKKENIDPYDYKSERFSRKNLTKELTEFFEEII